MFHHVIARKFKQPAGFRPISIHFIELWGSQRINMKGKRALEFLDMLFVTTYQPKLLAASFWRASACTTLSAATNLKLIFILKNEYETHSMDNLKCDHRQHRKLKDHWGVHENKEKCRQESPRRFKLKLDVCCHSPGQKGGSTILLRHSVMSTAAKQGSGSWQGRQKLKTKSSEQNNASCKAWNKWEPWKS